MPARKFMTTREGARLPAHQGLLLASGPLDGELLPPDCAVWLRQAAEPNR